MLGRVTDEVLRRSGLAFPGAAVPVTEAALRATLAPGERLGLIPTSTSAGHPGPDGEQVAVISRPGAGGRSTLFLYGNAMTMADTGPVRDVLASRGAGVVCVDYAGYGLSAGLPGEGGCYRAAQAALSFAEAAVGAGEVDVVGWSLGSAVALQLAATRDVRRLALLSPMSGVAPYLLSPLGLQSSGLRRLGPFAGAPRVGRVRCPVLLIGGSADTLTPPWMARDLADGLRRRRGPGTELVTVNGAGHNDLFGHADVWRRLLAFLS